MSEVERVTYEVELKTRFDAAVKEIQDVTEELDELESTGEKLEGAAQEIQDAGRKIAKSMEVVSEATKATNGDIKTQTSAYEDLLKKQKEWASAARKNVQDRLAANPKSTDGTGINETRKLTDAEIARRLAVDDAATQNEISNLRKVAAERKKAADSLADYRAKTAGATKSGADASEAAQLDRETAAQKRLNAAQREYRNAKSQQTRAVTGGDTEKQLAAEKRLLAAVLEKNKATAIVGDIRKTQAAKEIAAIDAVARAERAAAQKLADFRSKTIGDNYTAGQKVVNGSTNSGQKDAHVQARSAYNAQQLEAASKQNAIYNQYLFDEAKAAEKARTANVAHTDSLISARYALYDVATTLGVTSAAMLVLAGTSAKFAIAYESAFTAVERTSEGTGEDLVQLESGLKRLSTQIPISFEQLSSIAALGNQLGVAEDDVEAFTGTIARFSAVTGITADASAQAFGRIANILGIPIAEAEKLGSAITLVGRKSASTEAEIIALTERLGASGTRAGLTTDQVVGLAGALGSLGVAPERAQGVFETYFNTINEAVSEGGEKLEHFSQITGLTTDAIETMVRSGQGFEVFQNFLSGLQGADTVQLTGALDALGLTGLRSNEVIGRISQNLPLLQSAFADASTGFAEGTELQRQYALVADDVASKVQILQNVLAGLAATAGAAITPALAVFLDEAAKVLTNIDGLLQTDAGQGVAAFVIASVALVGALLAIVAAGALAAASTLAIRTALIEFGFASATATTGARGFIGGLFGVTAASGGAAVALNIFKVALAGTGIGLAVVLLGTLAAAFLDVGTSAETSFTNAVGSTAGLAEAMADDTLAYQNAIAAGNTELAGSYTVVNRAVATNSDKFDEATQTHVRAAQVLGGDVSGAFDVATDAAKTNSAAMGENTVAWLRNSLMQNQAFKELVGSAEFTSAWTDIGANFEDAAAAAAKDGQRGVQNYFQTLANQALASGKEFKVAFGQFGSFDSIGTGLESSAATIANRGGLGEFSKTVGGLGAVMQTLGFGTDDAAAAVAKLTGETDKGGSSLGGYGNKAKEAAKRVYTLVDYANDLSGVFNRAFEIRYAAGSAADAITTATRSITDGFADADEEVKQLTADLIPLQRDLATSFSDTFADVFSSSVKSGLTSAFDAAFAESTAADAITNSFRGLVEAIEASKLKLAELKADLLDIGADQNIKQYQLKVAIDYGDTLRADKLRAELAELALKEAKTRADIAKEGLAQGRETTGNTDAAIANRAALSGLVSQYQKYLSVLVDTGANSADLAKAVEEARENFQDQGKTLGFSTDQLATYSDVFSAFSTAAAVAQIEANRAALEAQAAAQKAVTDAVNALKVASDAASRSLEGNSAAAIANRAAITDLVSKNQAYIVALAASGAGTAELTSETNRLRGEFVAQMQAAGMSTAAVSAYARSFDDMSYAIARVPRNLTIDVDARTNPAEAAYVEFRQRLNADAARGLNIPVSTSFDGTGSAKAGRATQLLAELAGLQKQYDIAVKSGADNVATRYLNRINVVSAALNSGGYREGGYTGNVGVNQEAGVVHGKEFVFSAPAVKTIGVDTLGRAHEMAKRGQTPDFGSESSTSVGGGRGGNGGIQVVELSAYDRNLLRESGNRTLTLDGKVVADSNSNQNTISARKGSN